MRNARPTASKRQRDERGLLYRWLVQAAERGSDRAIVYRDTYLSWHGLLHRVDRRASELAAMDIRAGDWVGLMLGNVPDLVILSLAAARLGATVVPLDPTLGSRDLHPILSAAPLRALITRPRGGESAPASALPDRSRREIVPEARRRLQGTLLGCAIYPRRGAQTDSRMEAVIFTSGSAGEPKGVARTADILAATTDTVRAHLDLGSRDRILAAVPLFHGYGFDLGLALALRCGATLILEDEFNAKRMHKALREQGATFCPGIPTMYESLAMQSGARPRSGSARFLCAGAPLEAGLAERFHRRWGARLLSCYHTTEAGPISIDQRGLNPASVGKPLDGIEVRVGNGKAEGPIWVRGPAIAPVLVGKRSAPGRIPVGGLDAAGWLRTGDVGRLDRLGRLYLGGREDDLVKVDGRRVALGEVEACIEAFPKVAAARAFVVSDPLTGAVVIAKVVPSGDCAPEEIIDHCARNLASYKVPRRVRFVKELSL
jgi:long-chain acyl-CoA synthetase